MNAITAYHNNAGFLDIKGAKIIVEMKFGSHLYGTATSNSDADYKGVFLPSKRDILLGDIQKSHNFTTGEMGLKNTPDDIDVEFYSLHYFIKLACDGQTVAMDMLHAPDDMIIRSSDIWREIVKNRERFYTKNLRSFIDYARRQASKYGIKGSRLNAVENVLTLLRKEEPSKRLRDIWDSLPRMEHCYEVAPSETGLKQYQVCGKYFQESVSIGHIIPVLEKFFDEYGQRARLAAENRNIDWKAVSHALRAAYQTREILTDKTIVFPLKEARFLMQVKQGTLDYLTDVAPTLESLMDEVEELAAKSSLPESVDRNYWDDFICKTVERELFSSHE